MPGALRRAAPRPHCCWMVVLSLDSSNKKNNASWLRRGERLPWLWSREGRYPTPKNKPKMARKCYSGWVDKEVPQLDFTERTPESPRRWRLPHTTRDLSLLPWLGPALGWLPLKKCWIFNIDLHWLKANNDIEVPHTLILTPGVTWGKSGKMSYSV